MNKSCLKLERAIITKYIRFLIISQSAYFYKSTKMSNVCKFYINGSCRYGDDCWNIHPNAGTSSNSNYNEKGNYYVSDNRKSLWRTDSTKGAQTNKNVSFSFNQALQNRTKTSNRYSSLSDDEMDNMYSEDYNDQWKTTAPDHKNNRSSFTKTSFTNGSNKNFGFHQNQAAPSQFSLSHLSKAVSNKFDGLFQSKPSNNSVLAAQQFSFAPKEKPKDKSWGRFQNNPDNPVFSVTNSERLENPQTHHSLKSQGLFQQDNQPLWALAKSNPDTRSSVFDYSKKPQMQHFGEPRQESNSISNHQKILGESQWSEKYNCKVYSEMESLDVSERNFYIAETFKLGQIPVKPPPKELCH